MVLQWRAGLNTKKAIDELEIALLKLPWLAGRLPELTSLMRRIDADLDLIGKIITAQEKQLIFLKEESTRLHEYIRVNNIADDALIRAIGKKFNLE